MVLDRFTESEHATLGVLTVDDEFQCFTLEDEHRDVKVVGETRIPAGVYKVELKNNGLFHARYSSKFPTFHQGMLQLVDVPNFTDILIHIGNTDDDTSGCILVGTGCVTSGELMVTNSRVAYTGIYCAVVDAAREGDLWIQIE